MSRAHIAEDGRQGPLSAYLNRIDQYNLLTPDEERRLAMRWRRFHDQKAAERLVTGNLRFVVKIAFEYRTYGVRLLDLIQEGNLGLIVAVDRFDPGRAVRLTTYAVWWIRAYIQEYIRRSWSMVRFGTTRAEQRCFYRLRRERQRLEREGGKADPEKLAAALGVSTTELEAIESRITRRDMSLDDAAYVDTEETRGDRIADDRPGPEANFADEEVHHLAHDEIQRALDALDPRERDILHRRYLAAKPATLKEIGAQFGISRERVRQLEARAMAKLREKLEPLRLAG
ncbi:MAG: polymerase sigma factor RpoH [Myxococcales bacterium]|nr:polymerase sigma factor RpoH [Myxococcales bacterium]